MTQPAKFQTTGGRRADRKVFECSVQFRSGTRRAHVMVRDISRLGARISGVFLVHEDDRLFVKLGNLEPIEARVAWVSDFEFGCEFLRPLNEVIFETFIGRLS